MNAFNTIAAPTAADVFANNIAPLAAQFARPSRLDMGTTSDHTKDVAALRLSLGVASEAAKAAGDSKLAALLGLLARGYALEARGYNYAEDDADTAEELAEEIREAAEAIAGDLDSLAAQINGH